MTEIDIVSIAIRGINAGLWVALGIRILRSDRPLSGFARKVAILVIVFGMGILFLSSLTPFIIPATAVRLMNTAFTSFAAIAAIALLTTGEPHGLLPGHRRAHDTPGRAE